MLKYAFSWDVGTKFMFLVLGFEKISVENWIEGHTFKPLFSLNCNISCSNQFLF